MLKQINLDVKFGLLLIPIALLLIFWSWQRWLVITPQPLDAGTTNTSKLLAFGQYYEIAISPVGSSSGSAHYRLWIPHSTSVIRGVIIRQHGCGAPAAATGLDHANDLQWQALAAKHQLGLIGIQLPDGYPLCSDNAIADRATEQAFLDALTRLARETSRPELDKVPWVFWGHSGGADWGMQMLRHHPERVIAVINMRCGGILNTSGKSEILDLDPKANAKMFGVPVFWAVGGKDPYVKECVDLPQQIFSRYRSANAVWTIAIEPNAQHDSGNSRFMVISYLDAILPMRLARSGTQLQPINVTQGWLGNPATYEVDDIRQYRGNPLQAAWLPNADVAVKWREYVKTGKIAPTRKPAPPFDVKVTRIEATKILITWNFIPDLENGLPQFQVYRNNALIKTFSGQQYNFGDAPNPPVVALECLDNSAPSNATYSIAASNSVGSSFSTSVRELKIE